MNEAKFEPPKESPLGVVSKAPDAKRTVLAFNRHFLPGFRAGGPIRTLINMTDRLGDYFTFLIVTQDRDLGDSERYPNIHTESWNTVRKAQVRYLPTHAVTLGALQRLIQEAAPHVIYLNSFFDPLFTQRILWLKWLGRLTHVSVVLAPRGELSLGALTIKSTRKKIYLCFTRMFGLHRGLVWQASSELEGADIRRSLPFVPKSTIKVARNLAPVACTAAATTRIHQLSEPLRVCFLSRIVPKKNLDFALSCLRTVEAEVRFTIFGPREDAKYWALCEEIMTSLPINVTVCYAGEIANHRVQCVLAQQDLFFFPTRGENYGHVIHEALAAGLPVLISDTTPWDGVVGRGVGWVLPLAEKEAYARIIDNVATWTPAKFEAVRYTAADYAAECAEDYDVLKANERLFTSDIA